MTSCSILQCATVADIVKYVFKFQSICQSAAAEEDTGITEIIDHIATDNKWLLFMPQIAEHFILFFFPFF